MNRKNKVPIDPRPCRRLTTRELASIVMGLMGSMVEMPGSRGLATPEDLVQVIIWLYENRKEAYEAWCVVSELEVPKVLRRIGETR